MEPALLHQVLEDEYAQLHQALPAGYLTLRDQVLRDHPVPKDKKGRVDLNAALQRDRDVDRHLVPELYRLIHALDQKRSALCLSGGGIRSATFCLGVLQGLARNDLLHRFDYLSTVSGGGYIGGWLSAWVKRHQDGLPEVTRALRSPTPRSTTDPEVHAIRHLRDYSNFIAPRVGLFSADTWTFVGIVVRNWIVNGFVFLPLLAGILMIPRLAVAIVTETPPGDWARRLVLVAGGLLAIVSLIYVSISLPNNSALVRERSRFWLNRANQGGFVRWCLFPFAASSVLLTTYWAWSASSRPSVWEFALYGAAVHFLAWAVMRSWLHNWSGRYRTLEGLSVLGLGAVAGLLACLVAQMVFATPGQHPIVYVCFAAGLVLALYLVTAVQLIGVASQGSLVKEEDREWHARFGAWIVIVVVAWCAFSGLVLAGPLVVFHMPKLVSSLGGLMGIITLVAGYSAKTPGSAVEAQKLGLRGVIMNHILSSFALLFIAAIVVGISLMTSAALQVLWRWIDNWKDAPGWTAYLFNAPCVAWPYGPAVHELILRSASPGLIVVLMVALVGFGLGMAAGIDLNAFSLHAAYRNRLTRAYLGASRAANLRRANPFTGFDPADDICMHELRPGLLDEDDIQFAALVQRLKAKPAPDPMSKYLQAALARDKHNRLWKLRPGEPPGRDLQDSLTTSLNACLEGNDFAGVPALAHYGAPPAAATAPSATPGTGDDMILRNRSILDVAYPGVIRPYEHPARPRRLLPVVNMTLNLMSGDNLAWQQRKAEPFTASPLYAGCYRLGYRRSRDYGGSKGISYGTAMAISGAAVSSSMGYYTTSPLISFALTVLNARLGWWLGNPGRAGDGTYPRACPRFSIRPVIAEALGLVNDHSGYVYLSDGGHFDNLGLYEMVLRRCHVLLVIDATADHDRTFGDLGNALRKIRIDLGVPIEFEADPGGMAHDTSAPYCSIARVNYKCVDGDDAVDGTLVLLKPAVRGDEPGDVLEYFRSHPTFPHESTADQFFSEAQFESYRALGAHIVERICDGELHLDLKRFCTRARQASMWPPSVGPLHPEGSI